MSDPSPILPLLTDPRTAAFNAFVAILQTDPQLSELDILWRTPDDTNYDDELPAETDGAAVRLMPIMLPMTPVAVLGGGVRSFEAPVQVDCKIRIFSYVWGDTANLAGAILAAVSPSASNYASTFATMQAAGITQITPTSMPTDYGADIEVTASFVLTVYITV